ncbi:MAG: stoA [Ignavibacteria bacterium]|nr:stoA [Ignavibacteria bacterium]
MKKTILAAIFITIISVLFLQSGISGSKKIPSAKVKNLKGETIDTKNFSNDGKPFVIDFWATWCKPCIHELNVIKDLYPKWQKETGVKFIAVSIDDSRNSKKVAPLINGKGWTYDIYLDENSDFKRAMNVNNPPHTFLCNGKGEIVWEHNGFADGDEKVLYEQIKKISK